FTTKERKFEIMTPARGDLAKGKKVVLSFIEQSGSELLLCVDSDFDYLFGDYSAQSRQVNESEFVIQTYAYAIENLLCWPPSLASVASKATKNDSQIFDFEEFMADYSTRIYPLFLWYLWAAKKNMPEIFSLSDFRNAVRLNYLNINDNGRQTLEWLERVVQRRMVMLRGRNPKACPQVELLGQEMAQRGVTPATTHLYMQGHALLEGVVTVILQSVCERMRDIMVERINSSQRTGLSLKNELSYYNNSLQDIETLLSSNLGYMASAQYGMIAQRITTILNRSVKTT
ncbi:MAG: DUF4435 domain-containing protein, partial [Mucinivorans sp.]